MSNLVHNERLKLRATFLSNLGIAAFIACFITPGFFEFAETRIERFIMALIGLLSPRSGNLQAEWIKRMTCSNYAAFQTTPTPSLTRVPLQLDQ